MIKRIFAITIAVALFLSQSGLASAYDPNDLVTAGPFTATVNLSDGDVDAELAVIVKDIGGGVVTDLSWAGVNLGDGWTKSGQYLEVAYVANQLGWGVQVYTDNLNSPTTPYPGRPTTDPSQQPAGLIGQSNAYLTCPMAILVEDDTLTDAQLAVPVQDDPNDPGSHFVSGYNKVDTAGEPGSPTDPYERTWFFLKDIGGTVWEDDTNVGVIDPGEIVPSFNNPAGYPGSDDYATIVETTGFSSGWVHPTSGFMQRVAGLGDKDKTVNSKAAYSLNVYLAADFSKANELQVYATDTITLELYNE